MINPTYDDKLIKNSLIESKTIAMVGISSEKKEKSSNIVRRPSIIVMNYLQEFGYKVIPINPFSAGKKINGETILEKLDDIKVPVDIVNIFRPSSETPKIAKEATKIGAKIIWLQFGIHNEEAEKIAKQAEVKFIWRCKPLIGRSVYVRFLFMKASFSIP